MSKVKVHYPTKADISRAEQLGKLEHQIDAKRLGFRPEQDVIDLELFNGMRLSVPRRLIPALAKLQLPIALEMKLNQWGDAIEIRSVDLDVSISGTLRRIFTVDAASRAGSVKTEAKAAAARANGRLGGRPPKTAATATPARRGKTVPPTSKTGIKKKRSSRDR